jgi:GrpB-like predicted nucleotidyltransferase (UPF0157 family)
MANRIQLVEYDPRWPELFEREAERIRKALGDRALRIEHTGSTAVPGLAAKPVIDIVLVVRNSADEDAYRSALERAGYSLRLHETEWYEHRMFKGPEVETNLHVFSEGCPEVERVLMFRDWLRENDADRDLYAAVKKKLAEKEWNSVDEYASAKSAVIGEILARAQSGS